MVRLRCDRLSPGANILSKATSCILGNVMATVKEEEVPLDASSPVKKMNKMAIRRLMKKRAIERDRLAEKIQYFEWKTKEIESRKSGNTVTIGTDLLKRIRFPRERVDGEVRTDKPKKKKTVKSTRPTHHGPSLSPSSSNSSNSDEVSESRSKKRKSDEMTSEHKKEKKLKSSTKKQKERKQAENWDEPLKKKKKRDEKSQKSHKGDSRAVNGGSGMNMGAAGFGGGQGGGYGGGGQGQFGGGSGGGPQFGNRNPMESFSFHGNPQFNEQNVSEVMQAMQVLANHNILRLGFGVGVGAMAQSRTGQESQMTANHGSAGFGDGYGGGVQGGGPQGDQSSWRQ
ncbi:hypothetical protein CRE_21286 [Caenorhabditis remanei]|uniref:Uncharacterized protein n=1 Tax=Caenorhabditis remanei TaxID=31234 RepID=E3MF90_CAERE|nr:hypothetical protein CRE_21286 [Caenorhabditis remanei]